MAINLDGVKKESVQFREEHPELTLSLEKLLGWIVGVKQGGGLFPLGINGLTQRISNEDLPSKYPNITTKIGRVKEKYPNVSEYFCQNIKVYQILKKYAMIPLSLEDPNNFGIN